MGNRSSISTYIWSSFVLIFLQYDALSKLDFSTLKSLIEYHFPPEPEIINVDTRAAIPLLIKLDANIEKLGCIFYLIFKQLIERNLNY